MWQLLKYLQKKLVWSIPGFMILGLIFGKLYSPEFLKNLIMPLTFLMVYPMMVTMNINELFSKKSSKLQWSAILVNFLITPFIGYFLGKLFFADIPAARVGLLLTALLPTSGMTISWTGFAKGNMSAAVKMTIIGLIVGSLATPVYLKILMGTAVNIQLSSIFTQIIMIVFIPMLLGYLTQRILVLNKGEKQFKEQFAPKFPLLSTIGVLGVVFVSMALKSKTILSNPMILSYYLLPLVFLYIINFMISTWIGKVYFNRADAIAFVYGTVMRNLSIALAIAMSLFGEQGSDIALIISLAYIIQVQAGAWYMKLSGKFFPMPVENY